jgi:uncharacterized protein YbcC (UPF0753/DUF2309 family)
MAATGIPSRIFGHVLPARVRPVSHTTAVENVSPEIESDLLAELKNEIEHAAHFLPAQGPITVFIHHNTLHAFEHLRFDEGVQKGGRVFGCQPYLTEERFRQELKRGRIQLNDLQAVLTDDLGRLADQPILAFGSRASLRLAMMRYPLRTGPQAELHWFVAETDALSTIGSDAPNGMRDRFIRETRHWIMRDLRNGRSSNTTAKRPPAQRQLHETMDELVEHFGTASIENWSDDTWESFSLRALWRICRGGVQGNAPTADQSKSVGDEVVVRHRDLLFQATGSDSDTLVNELLVRFCAAFLDQGFSRWPLPSRERGFFQSFIAVEKQCCSPEAWLRALPAELRRIERAHLEPLESIEESLRFLGVQDAERPNFIRSSLLALRGWAGMIRQVELRSDAVAQPIPAGTLVEYLAVRLILERIALAHLARADLGYDGSLAQLRAAITPTSASQSLDEARAFQIFQVARVMGWLPSELFELSKAEWHFLIDEIESFNSIERRRLFQAAYERRYRVRTLDAITAKSLAGNRKPTNARFQVMCCLDEREESFRRHLEEQSSLVETFGAAGFYGVAIYYRGVADANFVPLCPIVIKPQHWVTEDVVYTLDPVHRRRSQARKAIGKAAHQVHLGSRTFAGGALLAGGLGAIASVPMVARVLFPRIAALIRRKATQFVQPPSLTQIQVERKSADAGPTEDHCGYSLAEMVNIGERLLRDIGLTKGFARIVLTLGHGSNSLNNPHNSAYNCGACGGGAGGPNARTLSRILNDARVRERLADRGLNIPDDTVFIGGFHNTCNDEVTYLDLDAVPKSHRTDLADLQLLVEEACNRNAHERCRRFESASLNLSFPAARQHVQARSEDLAQVRPELGHATNAVCFVGRRERVRGLFMDRRTFLTSYDPTQDTAEQAILTRLLQAAVPVCAGINLEYYFSHVDSAGYGCGTKLPHNVTSLLGVMDGAASDLRTGLPWQMVEIHEPVRLLFIIESTPAAMNQIMDRNEGIGRNCRNGWVQLATLDPHSSQIHVLNGDRFELYQPEDTALPTATTSADWYRGWREHLGFALIAS